VGLVIAVKRFYFKMITWTILSTDVAGGFVGTVLGPYARLEPDK
jgi:hypothetical protein